MAIDRSYQEINLLRTPNGSDEWGGPGKSHGNPVKIGTLKGTIHVESRSLKVGDMEKSADVVTHTLYTDVSVEIILGDVVELLGNQYRVTSGDYQLGVAGRQHHRELLLRRIDGEGV